MGQHESSRFVDMHSCCGLRVEFGGGLDCMALHGGWRNTAMTAAICFVPRVGRRRQAARRSGRSILQLNQKLFARECVVRVLFTALSLITNMSYLLQYYCQLLLVVWIWFTGYYGYH